MQLFSELLQKSIDFPEDAGVSPHEILEQTILAETDADYDFKPFICDAQKTSVLCIIRNGEGRRVVGVGESNEATLNNQIAKDYPVRMAVKRAFDYAAVRFLGLPVQDYALLVEWGEQQPEQNEKAKQEGTAEPKREKATAPAQQSGKEPEGYEKTIVTIGRQKGKNYTVEELAEKDFDSLIYIAYTYPEQFYTISEERRAVVNACQRWLTEHNYEHPTDNAA